MTVAKGDDTKRCILDAAEKQFSALGYQGASMRAIAEEAGVRQALLHYHFASKENLFETTLARRVIPLNERRLELLQQCFGPDGQGAPAPDAVVDAFFRPLIEMNKDRSGTGKYYGPIIASIVNSNDPVCKRVLYKYFNDMAQEFIRALRVAIPDLSDEDSYWGYYFMMGTGIVLVAQTGRLPHLSSGLCDPNDAEAVMGRIVPFVVEGLLGVARRQLPPIPPPVPPPVPEVAE